MLLNKIHNIIVYNIQYITFHFKYLIYFIDGIAQQKNNYPKVIQTEAVQNHEQYLFQHQKLMEEQVLIFYF